MNGAWKQEVLLLWTFLGVPLTFALFVAAGYAIWGPSEPFKDGREYLFLALIVAISLSGALAVATAFSRRSWWFRITAAAVYFASMWVVLPFVTLLVGCFNGDCL